MFFVEKQRFTKNASVCRRKQGTNLKGGGGHAKNVKKAKAGNFFLRKLHAFFCRLKFLTDADCSG
jgi:hypothetical protein